MSATATDVIIRLSRSINGVGVLSVRVADRCNHSCEHCYQVQGLKGELSFDELLGVFRSFRDAGGFVLSLTGGESTLRSDLPELVEAARDVGLVVELYTNGYLVTPELARRLAAGGVWMTHVSVYSDVAAEHDAVTRVEGSWERTIGGIRELRRVGVQVLLKHVSTRYSTATADRMMHLATDLGCSLNLGDHIAAGEAGTHAPLRARPAAEQVAALQDGDHLDTCSPAGKRGSLAAAPCGAGAAGLSVRSDGVVTPCTMLSIDIGDARDARGLGAVVEESEVAGFFRRLSWQDIHGCRDCDLRALCHRCHASALGEVGDLLAPYPGACEVAAARHARTSGNTRVLPPAAGCPADRDAAVGPYRVQSDGSLLPIPDVITHQDDARARQFPWIRPSQAELDESAIGSRAAGGRAAAGQKLVQLRLTTGKREQRSLDKPRAMDLDS